MGQQSAGVVWRFVDASSKPMQIISFVKMFCLELLNAMSMVSGFPKPRRNKKISSKRSQKARKGKAKNRRNHLYANLGILKNPAPHRGLNLHGHDFLARELRWLLWTLNSMALENHENGRTSEHVCNAVSSFCMSMAISIIHCDLTKQNNLCKLDRLQ